MALPSAPEQRTKLLAMIQDAIKQKLIITSANDVLKDTRKHVKEEFSMEAKEFNFYVESFLDENYPEEAFSQLEEYYHNYEILTNKKEEG